MMESLWEIAHRKIDSIVGQNPAIDGKVIKDSHAVLKILRLYNILPLRISHTKEDNEIVIGFNRCSNDYDIYVDKESVLFSKDKKRCFYRRKQNGSVDSECQIKEFDDLNELKKEISDVKKDLLLDFTELVSKIEGFESNWHINYRKSNKFSQNQIDVCKKVLVKLNNQGVLPMVLLPIVIGTDAKVVLRLIFQMQGLNFLADILDENIVELKWGEYLSERPNHSSYTFDQFMIVLDGEDK